MSNIAVRKSAQAEEDLIDIWSYVAASSQQAADGLLDRIDRRWKLLATQPYSGMERADIAVGVRHVVVGNYLTFYRVETDAIVILRVLDGRRDFAADDIVLQESER